MRQVYTTLVEGRDVEPNSYGDTVVLVFRIAFRSCAIVLFGCGRIGFEGASAHDGSTGQDILDGQPDAPFADATPPACRSYTAFESPRNLVELNGAGIDWAPAISQDELTIYFVSSRNGTDEIWTARRPDRTSVFSAPQLVTGLPAAGSLSADPDLTADSLQLWFSSTRGDGAHRLYRSVRSDALGPWSAPVAAAGLDGPGEEVGPSISADLKTLYYQIIGASDRLAVATRPTPDADFTYIRDLDEINSLGSVNYPTISADGRELFFIFYPATGPEIWVARRADAAARFGMLSKVTELDFIDSADWDPELSADGLTLYFASNRTGGAGGQDLYRAARACIP